MKRISPPLLYYGIIGLVSAFFIWVGYISTKAQMTPIERRVYDKHQDNDDDSDDTVVPPTLSRVYMSGVFVGLFIGGTWLVMYYVDHHND